MCYYFSDIIIVCSLRNFIIVLNLSDGSSLSVPCEEDSGGEQNLIAAYDRRGRHLITGNGKGKVGSNSIVNMFHYWLICIT